MACEPVRLRQDVIRHRGTRTYAIICGRRSVPDESRHFRHGLDRDDAFDREVRLVGERPSNVVCAQLIARDECVRYEILSPLVKKLVLEWREDDGRRSALEYRVIHETLT